MALLDLRRDDVTTSANFDWSLLHRLFARTAPSAPGCIGMTMGSVMGDIAGGSPDQRGRYGKG